MRSWSVLLPMALLGTACVRTPYFQPDARPGAGPLSPEADSVRGATAGRQYNRHGGLYRVLVGAHHRTTWAAPVSTPVLRLASVVPGGLRPGKIGGGFNSTSLGLTAANGQLFVLRTVDKDPVRAMPKWLRGTFLVNVLRDNVSSTNPYAALAVPNLAQAAGVAHSSPRLFYVRPNDPAFQSDSLLHFRGQLAYLEEKYAVAPRATDPDNQKLLNSRQAFAAVFTGPNQAINQEALLTARLLDAWLGDWDRHAGQWSWATTRPDALATRPLLPLPKDRDMVFYRLDDGLLGWLIGHVALRHWTTFGPHFGRPANLLSNGHYLDVRGLNGLTHEQFRAAALALQQVPDATIEQAVRQLPAAAYALEGPGLVAALKARRAALPALADAFYRQLARRPVVGGTAQAELFEIHRYPNRTTVNVVGNHNGEAVVLYQRTFLPTETRTVQLEGVGGNDVFVVTEHGPNPNRRPGLRIYGGEGHDELRTTAGRHGIRFIQAAAPASRAYDKLPEE